MNIGMNSDELQQSKTTLLHMSITLYELQSPLSHTTKINLCQAFLLLTHRKQHTVHAVKG